MIVAMIWAMTENRVIGRDNTLPWRLPTDMKHFMSTTRGLPVVMGRKTYESMNGALPGRTNIVLTRDQAWAAADAQVVHTIEDALEVATAQALLDGRDEVMIIGGAEIYAMGLPYATRLYVTEIHTQLDGDTFFPEFDLGPWRSASAEHHAADDRNSHAFTIKVLERDAPEIAL